MANSTTAHPSRPSQLSPPSPLANLIQSIHLPSHRFLLLTHPSLNSTAAGEGDKIELRLFAYPPDSGRVTPGVDGSVSMGSRPGSASGSASGSGSGMGMGMGMGGGRENALASGSASGSGSAKGSSVGDVDDDEEGGAAVIRIRRREKSHERGVNGHANGNGNGHKNGNGNGIENGNGDVDDTARRKTSLVNSGNMLLLWGGEIDLSAEENDEKVLAEAINEGYLHVDAQLHGSRRLNLVTRLDLKILPPDRDPLTFRLKAQPVETGLQYLFNASLDLLARPHAPITSSNDKAEMRSLRAQLSQKNDEIAMLSTKLASAKATVVRATASDNKKSIVSPTKKAPANASALQPNAKRRKIVEDDFAGSGSDDDI